MNNYLSDLSPDSLSEQICTAEAEVAESGRVGSGIADRHMVEQAWVAIIDRAPKTGRLHRNHQLVLQLVSQGRPALVFPNEFQLVSKAPKLNK